MNIFWKFVVFLINSVAWLWGGRVELLEPGQDLPEGVIQEAISTLDAAPRHIQFLMGAPSVHKRLRQDLLYNTTRRVFLWESEIRSRDHQEVLRYTRAIDVDIIDSLDAELIEIWLRLRDLALQEGIEGSKSTFTDPE